MDTQSYNSTTVGEEDVARPAADARFPPAPLERIGRFRITGLLGQGGFGRVFEAHDDDLDRQVAIKVPNPEHVSRPEDVEVYLREARILASLDHPHIVPVYEVGRTEDGLCYVVTRLIDGTNLATRIGRARPGVFQSAELVATVALALHHAHASGLVHRDIKPANILMQRSADGQLALRVADFGIGSLAAKQAIEQTRPGTPAGLQ